MKGEKCMKDSEQISSFLANRLRKKQNKKRVG